MGYVEQVNIKNDPRHWETWKDDNSLRWDRALSIRGRLLIESIDGKHRQPMTGYRAFTWSFRDSPRRGTTGAIARKGKMPFGKIS